MHRIQLGSTSISIPVADIPGREPGKTLVVTAGMDGDEYTGIEAAYRLIERYQQGDFRGRLIVLPIMNMPGFEAESSKNPLDGKFPKDIFPGNPRGTATEQLLYWFVTNHLPSADMWLDLHSGALSERLHPFLWTPETGVASIDGRIATFHALSGADIILFPSAPLFSKSAQLAKKGCAYVMAESGERGYQRRADVERHLQWAEAAMLSLTLLEQQLPVKKDPPTLWRHLSFVLAPCDGLWSPNAIPSEEIRNGHILGTYHMMDDVRSHELCAKTEGLPLWWKETMPMKKGELLCALARP